MQKHLCRTLAHHMVYLGTRLNLPISSAMERFILDAADSMWNKEGHFIWNSNWETANAEYDTDNDDKQQEEPSIDQDYLELDIEKSPVYFTEAYYRGDGHGPQESDSSAAYGEFPFGYLPVPVIEDMQILEHLNHGAALNTPNLDIGVWGRTWQEQAPMRVSWVSEPELHFFRVHTYCRYTGKPGVLESLQRLVRNWLLV
jgi:hypothetical protein